MLGRYSLHPVWETWRIFQNLKFPQMSKKETKSIFRLFIQVSIAISPIETE